MILEKVDAAFSVRPPIKFTKGPVVWVPFVLGEYMIYKKVKVKKGWIVVNCRTGAHSHFKNEYGCYLIMKFLKEGIYPKNSYLQESYRRLMNGKEKREKYKNVQGMKYG